MAIFYAVSVYVTASSTELFAIYLANRSIFYGKHLQMATFFFTISGRNWWFYECKFALWHQLSQGLHMNTYSRVQKEWILQHRQFLIILIIFATTRPTFFSPCSSAPFPVFSLVVHTPRSNGK